MADFILTNFDIKLRYKEFTRLNTNIESNDFSDKTHVKYYTIDTFNNEYCDTYVISNENSFDNIRYSLILKYYNLLPNEQKSLCTIYKYRITNDNEDPREIVYNIRGYNKVREIVKGELLSVSYYDNNNNLIIKEKYIYNRNTETGLAITKDTIVEWYLTNNQIGCTKSWTYTYNDDESVQEGLDRRKIIINQCKKYLIDSVGQTNSFDMLTSVKTQIEYYIDGYRQPLINAINTSLKPYMTQAIKATLVNMLTF